MDGLLWPGPGPAQRNGRKMDLPFHPRGACVVPQPSRQRLEAASSWGREKWVLKERKSQHASRGALGVHRFWPQIIHFNHKLSLLSCFFNITACAFVALSPRFFPSNFPLSYLYSLIPQLPTPHPTMPPASGQAPFSEALIQLMFVGACSVLDPDLKMARSRTMPWALLLLWEFFCWRESQTPPEPLPWAPHQATASWWQGDPTPHSQVLLRFSVTALIQPHGLPMTCAGLHRGCSPLVRWMRCRNINLFGVKVTQYPQMARGKKNSYCGGHMIRAFNVLKFNFHTKDLNWVRSLCACCPEEQE